jgi:hypothetical protein
MLRVVDCGLVDDRCFRTVARIGVFEYLEMCGTFKGLRIFVAIIIEPYCNQGQFVEEKDDR